MNKMKNVFNTTFEISLRVLLTLEASNGKPLTADMVTALEFTAVYGRDFGLSDSNLHGENDFKFGEIALRRVLTKEAIKDMVLDGLLEVESSRDGFLYRLSERGKQNATNLSSDYADTYRSMAKLAHAYLQGKSEREVLRQINKRSVLSVKRGEVNG
jgi:hypothetical protein